MGELAIFTSEEFGQVRGFMRDGEPWFVANDVAAALGYAIPKDAVAAHCKYATLLKGGEAQPFTSSPHGINVIPEFDVYALIFRSNLPAADKFRAWVCEEVLPQIRKTGSYAATPVLESPVDVTAKVLREAGLTPNQIAIGMSNTYRHLTGIDVLALSGAELPSPVQKQALTPTEISQELGEDFNPRQINKLLIDKGYQIKRVNGGYDPTELGEPHALLLDTAKRHSDGTPVKQLKWYTSILPLIKSWLE